MGTGWIFYWYTMPPSACCLTILLPDLSSMAFMLELLKLWPWVISAFMLLKKEQFRISWPLSQDISGPIHQAGHMLYLLFFSNPCFWSCAEWSKDEGDKTTSLGWTDCFLISFRLTRTPNMHRICPQRLMKPDGFLHALGNFQVNLQMTLLKPLLLSVWNRKIS